MFIRGMDFATPLLLHETAVWDHSWPVLAYGTSAMQSYSGTHGQCADSVVFPTWQSTFCQDLQARRVS